MVNKTWAIEDIYKSIEDWEKDYSLAFSKINEVLAYKGKLNEKYAFYNCMKGLEEVSRIIDKLSVYAMMLKDSDTRNSTYSALSDKVTALAVKYNSNCAFITPELTALDDEIILAYIEDKDLTEYDNTLKSILKGKKHVLTENEERILALSAEPLSSFRDIFTKIDNADLPLTPLNYKGEKIPMSHGMYGVVMHSEDRLLRKKYFKNYYGAYISLMNTISATYIASVKKDVFYAKVKKFNSALEMALFNEDVDEKVYKNLIQGVHKALPLLHRYIRLKKKNLKLKKMHMYDMYVPIVEDAEIKLSYEDAYKVVIEALSPLGEEYTALLKTAYENRWLDVEEKKGKRSGAYSVAVYDTHPYVLLNYQQTTHDIFTIAHEMGHSIHSYYSNKEQPYNKADYKIFVAEVASTVNEVLLYKHLLKNAKDKKVKKYLLSYLLEMIRTTLFRQTQFAEFEEFAHSEVEDGNAITKDSLSQKYFEINAKYYGKSVTYDEEIKYEWARIPHFYRAFYVYKYATGIISALSIVDRIEREGEEAVKDYKKFLSSGSSDNPVELLKIAKVDLLNKKTYEKAFNIFKDAIKEIEKL
ncbi:MAG: oligoendopeptidase F [Clostridia bacterium]|nr:oligoendopeptidase F [Clostridia bacterium]